VCTALRARDSFPTRRSSDLFTAKHTEALVYKALGNEGSVEDRKQAVRLDERVVKAWDEHFSAVRDYEVVKARREREVLVVDLWRSEEHTSELQSLAYLVCRL